MLGRFIGIRSLVFYKSSNRARNPPLCVVRVVVVGDRDVPPSHKEKLSEIGFLNLLKNLAINF